MRAPNAEGWASPAKPGPDRERAIWGVFRTFVLGAVVTVLLLAVASCAAGIIPALRASHIDPILALRYE